MRTVVCGDMNSELSDPALQRLLRAAGLRALEAEGPTNFERDARIDHVLLLEGDAGGPPAETQYTELSDHALVRARLSASSAASNRM